MADMPSCYSYRTQGSCRSEGIIDVGHRLMSGGIQRCLHRFWQRCTQPLADHCNLPTNDLDHLMARRRWIIALQQAAAATAVF
jgi:hypothetical protein